TAADCNDNNVCTYDSCDGGVCSNTSIEGCKPCATAADCNDNNACTTESCVGGMCHDVRITGCCTTLLDCDDHNACTTDTCDAGVCHHAAMSGCTPCTTVANCNDFNACTTDACIGGVCVHTNTCLVPKAAPAEMCGNCLDDDGNGLDRVKIQVQAKGSVRLRAGGKRAQMICPDAGALQMTVGFQNAMAGDGGNRSATTVQTFRAGPNGTLRIP